MKTIQEIQQNPRVLVGMIGLDGGCGEVTMPGWRGTVIWSFGGGWEHVSVCPYQKRKTPSWDDMCKLKDIFFRDDECVVQYHPPKSEYVNNATNCLHLWRPMQEIMPMPPAIMVGVKKGQTMADAMKEIEKLQKAVDQELIGK